MFATSLHHLGAPCVVKIRETDRTPATGSRILHRNPLAIIRREPGGAVITPPHLYAAFIHADQDLADALQGQEPIRESQLDRDTVALLTENAVLLESRSTSSQRLDCKVDCVGLPPQTLLDVTSACDCACEACYHIDDLHGPQPTLHDVLRRIDWLAHLGTCLFEVTGGEPTLRQDLPLILDHIHGLGRHYYVVTNGGGLAGASSALLESLGRGLGVAISLDGVGPVHDSIRRLSGLYDNLMTGLKRIHEVGIKPYFIATIHANNLDQIDGLIRVAHDHQTTVHLRPAIRTGNAVHNALAKAELSAIATHLGNGNVRNGMLASKKSIPKAAYYGCGIRKRISVSAIGKLYPCVMDRTRALDDIETYDGPGLVAALEAETKRFLSRHKTCATCTHNSTESCAACGGFCRFSCAYEQGIRL